MRNELQRCLPIFSFFFCRYIKDEPASYMTLFKVELGLLQGGGSFLKLEIKMINARRICGAPSMQFQILTPTGVILASYIHL